MTVRQTVDISDADHAAFTAWRMRTALAIGRPRLTAQDALSTLVSLALSDPEITRRAEEALRAATRPAPKPFMHEEHEEARRRQAASVESVRAMRSRMPWEDAETDRLRPISERGDRVRVEVFVTDDDR